MDLNDAARTFFGHPKYDRYYVEYLYRAMIERSLDCLAPSLFDLRCAACTDAVRAFQIDQEGFEAVAIASEQDCFLFAFETGRRRDPALAKSFPELFGEESPCSDEIRAVAAYHLQDTDQVQKIVDLIEEKNDLAWTSSKMCEVRLSNQFTMKSGGVWVSAHYSPGTIDGWQAMFQAVRQAFEENGFMPRHLEAASEYATRDFNEGGTGPIQAAEGVGYALAALDGYLPDKATVAALTGIETTNQAKSLEYILDMLNEVARLCLRNGHVDEKSRFDFNDMDNLVHAREEGGVTRIHLTDQNCRLRVDLSRNGHGDINSVEVVLLAHDDTYRSGYEQDVCIGRFEVSDGKVKALSEASLDFVAIRAWNSFLSDVESADAYLAEETTVSPGM